MIKNIFKKLIVFIFIICVLFAQTKKVLAYCESDQAEQLEQDMQTILDYDVDPSNPNRITDDQNFTVMLGAGTQGERIFSYSHGTSTPTYSYNSASTSKLPSAVIILTLIDNDNLDLTLDSKPHDLINFWTGESAIKLRDLLAFTSGFDYEKNPQDLLACLYKPDVNFATCVQDIYDANINANPPVSAPGTSFYYSGSHLKIAGLMAMNATGKNWSSIIPGEQTIFSDFQQETGLLTHSTYDLPSAYNPNLAGGMHWTAEDYQAFLKALSLNRRPSNNQPLLSQEIWNELFANQRGSASVGRSPILDGLGEDWAYGFGNWLECPNNPYDCGSGHLNSSPGAYGAYPFIDFDYSYFGIIARQGPSTGDFPVGVDIFRSIQMCAQKWAQADIAPTPTPTPTPTPSITPTPTPTITPSPTPSPTPSITPMPPITPNPDDNTDYFKDLELDFDKDDVKNGKTSKEIVMLKFKNTSGIRGYISSSGPNFRNDTWSRMDDKIRVEIDQQERDKQNFFYKFKARNGDVSDVYEKKVTFVPGDRSIFNFPKKGQQAEQMDQSGEKFSPNSSVALYFSTARGGYYAPVYVKTDDKGSFSLTYKINKTPGWYRWYAIDQKTNLKTKTISYLIL